MFKSLVLPTLMLLTVPALAQADRGNKGACRADIERSCPDAKGKKDVGACLAENAAALSEECSAKNAKRAERSAARAEKRAARKAKIAAACGADIEQFCAGKTEKALKQCMRANRESLSAECKAAAKDGRKKKRGKRGKGAKPTE